MNVASIIGTSAIIGIVAWIICFFFWTMGGKKIVLQRFYKKKIAKARYFVFKVDEEFPTKNIKDNDRQEREIKLAKSGFNAFIIDCAEKQNQKPFYKVQNFVMSAREKGYTDDQARGMLLESGFELNTINKAINKLNKEQPNATKERKARGSTDGTTSVPDIRGIGNRDVEVERKRVLPTAKTPTPERTKQPDKWDWSSISKNR